MRTDLTIIRGDSATFDLELVLGDATVPNLAGATASFIVDDLFTKTDVLIDESTGEASVDVDPEDTEGCPDIRATYNYNVQVTLADDSVLTLQRGLFIVIPDVTE